MFKCSSAQSKHKSARSTLWFHNCPFKSGLDFRLLQITSFCTILKLNLIFLFTSLKAAEHKIAELSAVEPMLRKELEICLEVLFFSL